MPSTSTKPTCSVESRCPTWLPLGIGLGLTGTAAIGLWGPLGVSTTYPRLLGQTLSRFVPDFALQPYLAAIGIDGLAPETMVVLGMLIGGLLMARLSRRPAPARAPPPSLARSSASSAVPSRSARPCGSPCTPSARRSLPRRAASSGSGGPTSSAPA